VFAVVVEIVVVSGIPVAGGQVLYDGPADEEFEVFPVNAWLICELVPRSFFSRG
jgi:hypothetical protein